MKLDVLSRICGFNITFKRGLLNVSMPLLKCFRGVIQLLRIAEGEGQRALCICVDKQHPLVLPGKSDAEVGGGRGLAHAAPFGSSPRPLCNSPYGVPPSHKFSRLGRSRRLCNIRNDINSNGCKNELILFR